MLCCAEHVSALRSARLFCSMLILMETTNCCGVLVLAELRVAERWLGYALLWRADLS
jgi:hypothetical protein